MERYEWAKGARVLIGIPTTGMMHADFVECLMELVRELDDRGVRFEVFFQRRTVVHLAREIIAEHALLAGFTHVLWLDSDMLFPAETLDILMRTSVDAGSDVTSGVYRNRHGKCGICLWDSFKPDHQMEALPDDAVFDIAGCGFGVVLTSARILDRVRNTSLQCFQPLTDYGEDLAFCYRAGKTGARLAATSAVMAGHIGQVALEADGATRVL